VEVDCLALFLVGLFVILQWDKLFVEVSEGRSLSAGVCGLGL
jgi:hypothetical protein